LIGGFRQGRRTKKKKKRGRKDRRLGAQSRLHGPPAGEDVREKGGETVESARAIVANRKKKTFMHRENHRGYSLKRGASWEKKHKSQNASQNPNRIRRKIDSWPSSGMRQSLPRKNILGSERKERKDRAQRVAPKKNLDRKGTTVKA